MSRTGKLAESRRISGVKNWKLKAEKKFRCWKRKAKSLSFFSFWLFVILAKKLSFLVNLEISMESRKLRAKSRRISGVNSWKRKAEKKFRWRKRKAKSCIIDGKAKSQKRKLYLTAFQLCLWVRPADNGCWCTHGILAPVGPSIERSCKSLTKPKKIMTATLYFYHLFL